MSARSTEIIIPLDVDSADEALALVDACGTEPWYKVGFQLFTRCGPPIVTELKARGCSVFLDLKFHDIPNTVQKAASAAARLGVWMLNVHALGGSAMMQAAREGLEVVPRRPFLIAVTVLTSLSENDLKACGIDRPLPQLVRQLTSNALENGLDGVVCSAREAAELRAEFGDAALLVTPGIRPEWAATDDQQRIVTPQQALADGASYLVIGRPITTHADPAAALEQISGSLV